MRKGVNSWSVFQIQRHEVAVDRLYITSGIPESAKLFS